VKKNSQKGPMVSIIMPVYNRAFMLREVLESLANQTYKNMEVVLVDDGSTDNPQKIARDFGFVNYIYQENGGCSSARNTGIRNARGEILLFIDSDVISPPDLVEIHVRYHSKSRKRIVQGQLIRIINLEDAYKMPFTISDYSRCFFDTANVSVRKEHMDRIGGFDEENFKKGWEDLDVGIRLLKLGLRLKRLVRKAYVWHYEGDYSQKCIMDFFNDRYNEGKAAVIFYRKYPTYSTKMMTMISPFFFWLSNRLFNEEYLKSDSFYGKVRELIKRNKIKSAINLVRFNGYCFYIKGIRNKIKEDGYIVMSKVS